MHRARPSGGLARCAGDVDGDGSACGSPRWLTGPSPPTTASRSAARLLSSPLTSPTTETRFVAKNGHLAEKFPEPGHYRSQARCPLEVRATVTEQAQPDADLLARAQAGDGEAFGQLTEPLRRELHVHCYRMLGSAADAEDLLQETLVAAWRGIGQFEGRSSLRAWL